MMYISVQLIEIHMTNDKDGIFCYKEYTVIR